MLAALHDRLVQRGLVRLTAARANDKPVIPSARTPTSAHPAEQPGSEDARMPGRPPNEVLSVCGLCLVE